MDFRSTLTSQPGSSWSRAVSRKDPEPRIYSGSPRFSYTRLSAVIVLCFLILPTMASYGQDDFVSQLMAQFIERFSRFIEWPADDPSQPFVIGVIGDSPIRPALVGLAGQARIKGKAIEVRDIANMSDIDNCQILFISRSERNRLSDILARARNKPILTVGDTRGFARAGVMINFDNDGDEIRFKINESAATSTGLRLAPKLLALGEVI